MPALAEAPRENSVRRRWWSRAHGLVRMASALDVLRRTPGNGTDAMLARARVAVGLGALRGPLGLEDDGEQREIVEATYAWLPSGRRRSRARASLAGRQGDGVAHRGRAGVPRRGERGRLPGGRAAPGGARALATRPAAVGLRVLPRRRELDGADDALWGLAVGGRFDEAYFTELSRNTRYLGPESKAKVLIAAARAGQLKPGGGGARAKVSTRWRSSCSRGGALLGAEVPRTDRTPLVTRARRGTSRPCSPR